MDPQSHRQPQPDPASASYAPIPPGPDAAGQPFYNAPPPGPSPLPYRPRPDAPENTPYPAASYAPPPVQVPLQTSSTTSAPPPSYMTNPAQPLTHLSPKPIPDPGAASGRFGPSVPGPAASSTVTFHPPPAPSAPINHTTANANIITTAANANDNSTLSTARAITQSALRELLAVRRQSVMVNGAGKVDHQSQSYHAGVTVEVGAEVRERVRRQTGLVLRDLKGLRARVEGVGERAAGERWRRWGVGGVLASFIPLVKRLFRRRKDDHDDSANRTEYAFKKSRSLVARILASAHRPGLGTLAFFVFAVLYIFQNEVALRVAKTVARRLKRLEAKVEEGREELTEADVKLLQGWRWRVLAWSE